MTPTELGKLFENIAHPDSNGRSEIISIERLKTYSADFETSNGSQWSRKNSWLGRKYNIVKTYNKNKVNTIQLNGFQEKIEYHTIPQRVREYYKNANCVFTGSTDKIEIDHKDARYSNNCTQVKDFQPVCKAMNDIKREICKKCLKDKNRPKGTDLGFSFNFLEGDEKSNFCKGCYYYDPIQFRRHI